MKFGPRPLADCKGAILAHSLKTDAGRLNKGHRLGEQDIEGLAAAGIEQLVVAVLADDDVHEDDAAARIAALSGGPKIIARKPAKGRVNLEAEAPGVLLLDQEKLRKINGLDEGLTVASLGRFSAVGARDLVASIKIIPFALSEAVVGRAEGILADGPLMFLAPFRKYRCALVQTKLPHQKPAAREKTRRLIAWRLERLGNRLGPAVEVVHEAGALKEAIEERLLEGAELLLIHGASATVDRRDIVPGAVLEAGGSIERFGMPVDPGNLLVLGRLGDVPVVGLPGCAGSPKLNGLDWVLERLVAGQSIGAGDFAAMGAGGLLKETSERPQPRQTPAPATRKDRETRRGALLLAAGASRRTGEKNKLLSDIKGTPLAQRALSSLQGAELDEIVVVLGHQADKVRAALKPEDHVALVENPDFESGLSSSLRAGLQALGTVGAAAVMLADMPEVRPASLDKLFEALDPAAGVLAAVPTWQGKRGNPVVWHRALFDTLMALEGDRGARALLEKYDAFVAEVPVDDPGVCLDVDTEQAIAALQGN